MATLYAIIAMVLAGAAIGYGWSLGGSLASASMKLNKKPHLAALVIVIAIFVAVLMNKVPMPF